MNVQITEAFLVPECVHNTKTFYQHTFRNILKFVFFSVMFVSVPDLWGSRDIMRANYPATV